MQDKRDSIAFKDLLDQVLAFWVDAPIAFCIIDEAGNVQDGNPAFRQLTGLHKEPVKLPIDAGWTGSTECILTLPDGRSTDIRIWVQSLGAGSRRACVVREKPQPQDAGSASPPSQAEHVWRESEQRLRDVLEMAQLNAVVLNAAGSIVFCNSYLLQTTGYDADEVLGLDWFDLFAPPSKRVELKAGYANWISRGQITAHLENELVSRSGSTRQVVWDNTLLRASDGSIIGAVLIGRDVTDQRRLEEQFRQAQRLETVGRLAGGIAHDFNNLLTVINGYADTALSDMSSFDPLYGMLEEIRRAGDRAARLTKQLLAFSRRQILELKETNVNHVVAETAPMLRRLIGEDIQLVVELHPGSDPIQADEGQLQQVIMSLAVNSRDAMPGGGKLTIKTSKLDVTSDHPSGLGAGCYVLLAVADTGCGMTDEVQSHVFEPFFTTKPTGKGTGLGLATVYGIVKQSGGHVWFDTAPGAGTTFYIAFPALVSRSVSIADEPARKDPEFVCNILVVEDQREVRVFARIALERAGYRVLEAGHGGEALDIVNNPATRVDLVISDVVMPDIGGYRLAEQVNQVRPGLPFLFVTGYPDIAEERLDGRAIQLLQKPFTGQDLIARVQEILPPRKN